MWLLHLSDRVSCDKLYGSGYSITPPSRKSRLIAVHLFFCHTLFSGKTQKARLRRYVFLVPTYWSRQVGTEITAGGNRDDRVTRKQKIHACHTNPSSHSFLLSCIPSLPKHKHQEVVELITSSRPACGRARQQWGSKKWFACVGSICREYHDRFEESEKEQIRLL